MTEVSRRYRWRLSRDIPLLLRATATNQLARIAPALYTRLTGETGRGQEEESPESVAAYFDECVHDYRAKLSRIVPDVDDYLANATVIEYGPGDVPGVALALVAKGAARALCVDRFTLIRQSPFNRKVLDCMAERLESEASRRRFLWAWDQLPSENDGRASDSRADIPVSYVIDENGYSGVAGEADLIISRAVLEHVNDLEGTFRDMFAALRPGGISLHKVDLRSHGLHREAQLDFLTWPRWAWWLMHSAKGTPNRWRLDRYRELAYDSGFELLMLEPVDVFTVEDVGAVRHALSSVAQNASDEDLCVATFWIALRKPQ